MHMTLERPELISLAAGFTDNESLPVAETRELMESLWRTPRAAAQALQYGSTLGDARLRQLTAEGLGAQDGGKYAAARLVITNGSQQLLYIIAEALCDPGDIVIV